MVESATFPYKTALSKANVKTNSKNWTYHKERGVSPTTTFFENLI